ncbi:MAG TPA: DUF898 family protein [Candidatus Cloacimonadota bacterium]|nr:DUF898 family protein [Candidatus Cloacimonadota bacterium]
MHGKFQFHGRGGELFSIFIVNLLLTIITLGIYCPWAIVKIVKYFSQKTTLDGVSFDFEGQGGKLFCIYLVNYLLTAITAGLYSPVATLRINAYFTENLSYKEKKFEFDATNACDFWCLLFVQGILTAITLGIYTPWAMIKIRKNLLERTSYEGVKFSFTANGGTLFCLYLIQGILTCITLCIYFPWAVAKITNYLVSNVTYGENAKFSLQMEGGDLFSIVLLHGIILIAITLGIYYPWFLVKYNTYQMGKMEVIET